MASPTSINRRGGGPLPEKNEHSHVHDAVQHCLSGVDARMKRQAAQAIDRGPTRHMTSYPFAPEGDV